MFVSRGPAPEWLARCSVGLVFGLFVCALFVAALFSGFRVVGCPKSASRLPTSGFVHFVGLVFGLFVCALFVAALFSGLLGARSPHRDFQGSLSTSGFVRFVGSVFGLFVYALFVMALFFFFRLRVSWLPGVDVSRQYFCALRRF